MPTAPSVQRAAATGPEKTYVGALALLATLFFMWGFITVLNDALIPHLKAVFVMNYTQTILIQVSWFVGYLLFSMPSAFLVRWIGYKSSIVVGLSIMAVGCLMFLPAANVPSYAIFLSALFVIAGGIALLQVAANPYVAILGPESSSSSRLNLVQSLNSFGTLLAPIFGSHLILARTASGTAKEGAVVTLAQRMQDAKAVQAPYIGIAVVLLLIALVIWLARLPKISTHAETEAEKRDSIFRHPLLWLGVVGIFVYVGAEVAVGSFMTNYIASPHVKGITTAAAQSYLTLYWGGLFVGRFVGAFAMRAVNPSLLLIANSALAILAITLSVFSSGDVAFWAILAVGLCNSIMFPTIFTQAIRGLGPLTGLGSGLLIMAIFGGGVVPFFQGLLADHIGLTLSYFTSAPCYLFIIYFGLRSFKQPAGADEAQARVAH